MIRVLVAAGTALVCGLALAAAPAPEASVATISLGDKANVKLKDSFHNSAEGNTLTVPAGEQTLEGVKFKVEEGVIQLGSKLVNGPEKVEGIKVDKALVKLHILHSTGYGGGPNQEGNEGFVADDTVIGKYVVHYEDKTKEEIEIVYGKDVRDWWFADGDKDVSRGKVAWKGENDASKQYNMKIRLFLTTWKNPKPDKKVVSIDYVSTKTTAAAPFCVAMTAETK